ncbi:hypothetical protein NYE70_11330 [Paenibacillus sp. FSL R5-0407]|uniref:hypothetical protein n=1 Tax=Paenibacillus sp. FSL R5-0407 TaxID=2975320 RepID=UPI0030F931E8
MKFISELVREAHKNAVSKGWWEEDRSFGEIIALIHSEGSEALEDFRNGAEPHATWYEKKTGTEIRLATEPVDETWKPCGIPSELADICIRIFDTAGRYNWGSRLEASAIESIERCFKSDEKYNSFPEHLTSIHFDLSQAWNYRARGSERLAIACLGHALNGVRCVAAKYNIGLDQAIAEKMAYNATRPHRHGGKVL